VVRWLATAVVIALACAVIGAIAYVLSQDDEPTRSELLRDEVNELREQFGYPPLTPAPTVVRTKIEEGATGETEGIRYTIEVVSNVDAMTGRLEFTYENLSVDGEARPRLARVIDDEGDLCDAVQDTPPPLPVRGESARFPLDYECAADAERIILGEITFVFD
jgi:hypothetical protein